MRNSYWALEWRLHWLQEQRRRCYHRWLGVIFVLTLLCVLLLFQGVLGLRIVEGNSMYPSLMAGRPDYLPPLGLFAGIRRYDRSVW